MNVYLFDWGDTLMVDFPQNTGKMCEWETVEAIEGARETLAVLSQTAKIYIATGAADSTEQEIKAAFERAQLSQYILGYFCKENIGIDKGTAAFLNAIISTFPVPVLDITMVGDSFVKDIEPAISVGITPIWFTPNSVQIAPDNIRIIKSLSELT
ncbi:HAD hydrolase-like protein [uncultured Psychromonas sp.]|uniref:HAD family hydrolase n=1 Tax=uncultured Psychromonas sp. TaxID=173974 RepID=UPI00261862F6|nr:HAD hydrolase-like protein [uncultured Psychromonas sp.]